MTAHANIEARISEAMDARGIPRAQAQSDARIKELEAKLAAVTKSRDKWKDAAGQQEQRADRQVEKAETAKKEAKAARGEFAAYKKEQADKRKAALAKRDRDLKTIRSDGGNVAVQIVGDEIHLHYPHYCIELWSAPLSKTPDAIPQFCMPALRGILAETPMGDWIKPALEGMGRLWRKDNGRVRMDDLGLTKQVLSKLEKSGITFVSEAKATDLASLPGIGPATVKAINAAIKKGPINVPGEPKK